MRTFLVLSALAAALAPLLSCGDETEIRPYDNNDLELITAYTAKEMCSCRFVMERDADYCALWTKADPAVASYRVDEEEKTVQGAALMMWGAKARYVSERAGCVLE